MKRTIQSIGFAILLFAAASVNAQEYDNINNRYGPPNYTGGTVASPSETFALYHQGLVNARAIQQNTAAMLEVYPNPAQNSTRIQLSANTTERVTVSVINMNGVIVRSFEYSAGSNRFDIDVSSLPDGIYALQVQEHGKEAQSIQLAKSQ